MKTKILFMVFLSIMAFALSSCNKETVEYRPAGDNLDYVIKTTKNGSKWGLVKSHATPQYEKQVVPCIYDSIYSLHEQLPFAYVGLRNGKNYAFDRLGRFLWEGGEFSSLSPIAETDPLNSAYCQRSRLSRFTVPGGNLFVYYYGENVEPNGMRVSTDISPLYFHRGPYENLFAGSNGYAYRQDGKWGIVKIEVGEALNNIFLPKFTPLAAPQYDGVIEVVENSESFWLVKSGGKWSAIDQNGAPKRCSAAKIRSLLRKRITDWDGFNAIWAFSYQRVGGDVVGSVRVPRG